MDDKKFSSEEMERYFKDPEYRHSHARHKNLLDPKHILIYSVIFVFIAFSTWYFFYIIHGLPTLEQLENPKPELATKIYSYDGELLDQFAYKNRTRVSLDDLPPGLINALIATEDKDFYQHWGVNLSRLIRQMVINVVMFRQAGASTITQQLARNLYKLGYRKESIFDKITRKIREFITSVQIERNFTKKEILELYLNVAYFGRNAYGIESAARTFFGKSASELLPSEYTLLIGMLKGPSYYDPILHPDRAFERRNYVINQMLREGFITELYAKQIKSDSAEVKFVDSDLRGGIAPHFVEWIRQKLLRKASLKGYDIYRDGLRIYTTLDTRMQKYAVNAINEHLADYQKVFDSTWNWKDHPEILQDAINRAIQDNESFRKARNAFMKDSIEKALRSNSAFIDSVKKNAKRIEVGFVAIDQHTGHIKAMVGGRNYFKYGLNHVTQIRRQPGSAFKPFVYTVAIDNGYPVCYEILNQPVTIPMPDGTRWTPENYDRQIGGKYTLREALKYSINLVAVRVILEIAPPKQVSVYAHRMGITSPIPAYESLALGTAEVTPLEITSAFGVFGNEGVYVSPIAILRIEDNDGNLIEQSTPIRKEVLSKETAYLMTYMLKGVVNGGTGSRVRSFFNGVCAGKTGTTNNYADAWFIGYTPHITAGIWVGFDDPRIRFNSSDGQGGRAAAPIFGRFMQKIYNDSTFNLKYDDFEKPDGIVTDTICSETKKKATEWCPNKITELFNAKYPISQCDKHASPDWNITPASDSLRKKSKTVW